MSSCVWSLYVCVCVSISEHTYAHMWRQKKVLGAFYFSLIYSPEKRSLTEPRACQFSARLAASNPHHSPCLHYLSTVAIGAHTHAWLLTWWLAAGDPDIGPQSCIASVLTH